MGDIFSDSGCSCHQATCDDADCRYWAKQRRKKLGRCKHKKPAGLPAPVRCNKDRGHDGKHSDGKGFLWA